MKTENSDLTDPNSLVEIQQFVVSLIQAFFKKYKIKYKNHARYDLWLLHYFNFRLKFVDPIKRAVKVSSELQTKLEVHPKRNVLNAIIQRTINGADLNPLQSKKSFDSSEDDGLFNDWGIHHLHLSINKDHPTDYFTSRPRPDFLVFVKFTPDTAYFIDIYEHSEKCLWTKKDLISIIQNNWNEIIKDKEVEGIHLTPDFNEEELFSLRKKGYLTGVSVNQKSYLSLGHGQASSGDNMMAGRLTDKVIRWIFENKEMYIDNKDGFKLELLKQLGL